MATIVSTVVPMEIDTVPSTQAPRIDDTVYVILDKARVGLRESIWSTHSAYLANAIQDAKIRVPKEEKTQAIELKLGFQSPPEALLKIESLLRFLPLDFTPPKTVNDLVQNEPLMKHLKHLFPPTDNHIVNKKSLKDPNESAMKLADVMNLLKCLEMKNILRLVSCYYSKMFLGTYRATLAHLAS